jgi:hypothetical protein
MTGDAAGIRYSMNRQDSDAENVDRQLDESQKRIEEARRKPLFESHTNNTHIDPRPAGDPRTNTARTERAVGPEGTAPTGEEPRD